MTIPLTLETVRQLQENPMLALILFYVIIPSDVHIEVSVEKSSSVEFSRTDKPGGKVGAVTVKVTIQNLADEALAFDQKKIDISVLRNKKAYLGYSAESKSKISTLGNMKLILGSM